MENEKKDQNDITSNHYENTNSDTTTLFRARDEE